ncbi:MAG: cobalamin B12-binding domain-containing protein [Caldilineae bacterium]|nr:cobalamin B12-binding domain-containing protein [Caldilineae bacterium]
MTPVELLLISPPDYTTREFRGAQPLGIAYLASVLREYADIPCRIHDANVNGPQPFDDLVQETLAFVVASKTAGGRPVVGISAVSQMIHTATQLAEVVKAAHPDTLIVLGGYHPTFAHREILRDFPAVDLCVRGEGELTLLEIMQRWQAAAPGLASDWSDIAGVTWRQGEEIVVNLSRANLSDLDAVPFPARDLLPPLDAYPPYADTVAGVMRRKASIMSSRGCPFHCNFCSIIAFYGEAGGKPWRGRSADNVVAEMVHLAETYGASHFEFQDDNFFVRPERALTIVETYAATGRDFSFAFLTRADQVVRGERFFPALRQAGLRYVSVGIESGSEASLERMVKQTGVETNRKALQILHDNDVAAQVEFIMFEPGSRLADLQENLQFIEQQGLFGYFPPLIFGSLLLLPGTPVREQIEQSSGVTGPVHDALSYEFSDPAVASVFDLMNRFQRRLGAEWYRLAFGLLDGIPANEIALQAADLNGESGMYQRLLAEQKLDFFALTRIPYAVMREALRAVAAGGNVPGQKLLDQAASQMQSIEQRLRATQAELDVRLLQ